MAETRDFLFEIGSEELPSAPLDKAAAQLAKLAEQGLKDAGLAHGKVSVLSTPRRLALQVADVADATEAVHQVFRGPAAAIAFDADGNPTKAAQGFARGKGVDPSALVVREDGGKEYVFAEVDVPAKPAQPLLEELAASLVAGLDWPRSQRWGSEHVRYGRPVRWMVCLFGPEELKVTYGDVESGRETFGHRVLAPGAHEIEQASDYEQVLERAFVLGRDERVRRIREGIAQLEQETGLTVETPTGVFNEVVNLCEWPQVLLGHFDEEFLAVPHEIICESMLQHQRYFPTYDANGDLTRGFVIVGNADPAVAETVVDGNERVVRARLDDAKFFFEEDLKAPLEAYLPQLEKVTFQERLGSMADKVRRLEQLAPVVAGEANGTEDEVAMAARAAKLAKADLVTQAVVEFTSQQGVMGGYYAEAAGEPEEVAVAVREHYRPRFAGDELPSNLVGASVAVADKLDTICGMFAIDEPPTGSSDPFAQRRSAIGVIHMLEGLPSVSLKDLVDASLDAYADQGLEFDHEDAAARVLDFFAGRLTTMARDEGIAPDTVAAVLAAGVVDPSEFFERARALQKARAEQPELFEDLATAYARAANLRDAELGAEVSAEGLDEAEAELLDACDKGDRLVSERLAAGDYAGALEALAALREPIDGFFENVMIMDEDPAKRERRLRLLNRFVAVFADVADFGAMAKK
ncbi:glycine--tRNA ligase subunit beta [Olsenella sp. YH-ols2217]|uniref:Glycine--tRNA ligase beta subunit n=1 Tax=Kribbibacterium absianum TaxID=3044210 RepID=A0ABT6ZIZ1_9ACTN|nr:MULTISPECIES: glycine--tRNA ligase subunit beta [unclassified Olsenella]MDJ1121531.1 glycine--tRNA ligase subunit beta [Olsenella sp. YH-ols2216]MDJ1129021.1 glycine--tRNA ligase subunit beta [Olsenella sp. YH-ols2217]